MALNFNARHLPAPVPEYVAWVDIMGTQASMSLSLSISANFIFKLHTAALQAKSNGVVIYPIMDGFYASSSSKGEILDFLRGVFESVADAFNKEKVDHHRFIIRGALAFGPVIHGSNVPKQASQTINSHVTYKDSLLLGLPMVQANACEKFAPPFGIYVHESARSFSPPGDTPIHNVWWKWVNTGNRGNNEKIWKDISKSLKSHYKWCAERSGDLEYRPDRIDSHKLMAEQYFV